MSTYEIVGIFSRTALDHDLVIAGVERDGCFTVSLPQESEPRDVHVFQLGIPHGHSMTCATDKQKEAPHPAEAR